MQLVHVGLLLTGARNPPGDPPEPGEAITTESGDPLTTEDGNILVLES